MGKNTKENGIKKVVLIVALIVGILFAGEAATRTRRAYTEDHNPVVAATN